MVKLDGLAALTAPGEKVGPMFYIAPEMLNNGALADGRASDVFALSLENALEARDGPKVPVTR